MSSVYRAGAVSREGRRKSFASWLANAAHATVLHAPARPVPSISARRRLWRVPRGHCFVGASPEVDAPQRGACADAKVIEKLPVDCRCVGPCRCRAPHAV